MKRIFILLTFSCITVTAWTQHLPEVYRVLEENYQENAFADCIAMAKQVDSFIRNRQDTLASNTCFYLGDAYNQLGETRKALSYFEREKQILQSLGMTGTEDYSNSLNNLAYLYLQDGNYKAAGISANALISNDRKLYKATDAAFIQSVLYVADIYLQLDRLKDSESLLLSTLKAQRGKDLNTGLLLNKLGDLYSYTGEYSRASRSLMEALDVHLEEAGEESPEYITSAINMGILYMNQGKYPEAQEIFDVALSKVDASQPAYAPLLNNQALVLQSLGQLEQAESAMMKIRRIDSLQAGTSHPDFAVTLSNLGLVYADLGKFTQAEHVLRQALAIQKENGEANTLSYARKLNNLAKVHQLAGAPLKAIPLLEQALSIFRQAMGKSSPEYATSTFNLGVAHWKAGNGETGYKYLRSSAAIRAKILGKRHPKYAESMLKIAEYQWHQKQVREAQQSFGEVFNNYYFQIDAIFPVLTEEEKSKFYYTNIRDAFDKYNSFAIEHHKENPALISDVYNYLINTKAAIMFATGKVRTAINESGDAALIKKFEVWQSTKEQIAKLYSLNQEHAMLDSLVAAATVLEKDLTRASSTFAGHMTSKKYAWTEIQQTLKAGEAAVEVLRFRSYDPSSGGSFSERIQYGFLVVTASTTQQPDLILMENGSDLETKYLRFYRNNIKYQLADTYSYQHYFQSLAEYLKENKIERVFLSPDGVYNQINVNGIQNPNSRSYLIEDFDIRLVTNTRELIEVSPAGEGGSPALIGYPKYNLDQADLSPAQNQKALRGAMLTRTLRGGLLRYMRGDAGISVLPGTQVEVEKIAGLLDESSAVYTEEQASESIAKSIDNPSVLHVATHGYFLEDAVPEQGTATLSYISNPLLNAGLILAGAENFLRTGAPINAAGDDGILTAFEAMNLKLDNTQLVVLSACETALGDVKNGEGVYGLQRAFKIAGARSIVMSLWSVDDEATQMLMTTFYEEMLRSGDQHQAFRMAQQSVKEKYPSPFYWAAFVMVGI